MIALIDCDIVAYRCAAASENEAVDIAMLRADKTIRDILDATQASEYICCFTGSGSFRKYINPEYKANRDEKAIPQWLNPVKEYIVKEWLSTVSSDGLEADDILGIRQCENIDNTIICSIDKDLLQIPGKHYNFVKGIFTEVNVLEGIKQFYKQLLIGDRSDNIRGVDGIGTTRAGRIIDPLEDQKEMFEIVRDLYSDDYRLLINGMCLWIMRKEFDYWTPTQLKEQWTFLNLYKLEEDLKSESTICKEEENIQSTEYIIPMMDGGQQPPGVQMEDIESTVLTVH